MDPISIIVTALVSGAAAAIKPTTEQVIKDAYAGIKQLIQNKYKGVNVAVLESDPASKSRQGVVKEDLEKTEAGQDEQLLLKAKALLEAIEAHAPDVPKTVGLTLKDIKAASLSAGRIHVKGNNPTGVIAEHLDIAKEIRFDSIEVYDGDNIPPKKA